MDVDPDTRAAILASITDNELFKLLSSRHCPNCGNTLAADFTSLPGEEWIELHGFEQRYVVSTLGRLYSLHARRVVQPRYVSRGPDRPRQLRWHVYREHDKVGTPVGCAAAVVASFRHPVGPGYTVRFRNGDDHDVRLDNLIVVHVKSAAARRRPA